MFSGLPPTFIPERSDCFTLKESLGVKSTHGVQDEEIGIKEGDDFYDRVDTQTLKRYYNGCFANILINTGRYLS